MKLSTERAPFVEPGLRPSPEQPSARRVYTAIAFVVGGIIAVVLGGLAPITWWLLVLGFVLVFAGVFLLRAFRFAAHRHSEDADMRKLYGRTKA